MQTPIGCPVCKNNERIVTEPESGEIICSNCGIVISDKTQDISRPERSAFNAQEANDRSRTGIPTSLARHDMGLATTIGKTDRDANGRPLDAAMRAKMQRLRTWDTRAQARGPTNKSLRQAFDQLNILKDKLGLSYAAVEKTAYIYRKSKEKGLVRGRTITAVLAAAVYIACRELGPPRTLKDVSVASNIKRKDLAKSYRLLICEFDFKVPVADLIKCIVRIANKVNLSEKTVRQAMSIMNDVTERGISAGKDPMGLAATVLYLSCLKTGEDRTQTEIAHASGVTDVTLRNRLKDLRSQLLITI